MTIWHHFQRGFGWGIGRDLARVIIKRIFG